MGTTGKSPLSARAMNVYLVLGATIPARIGAVAGTSGNLTSITLSSLFNRFQLPGGSEEPPAATQVKSHTKAQS